VITADDVYAAFVDAGPTGLAMAAITRLHKADPDRPRALPTERAAAGRHIRALLDAHAIEEVAKGRWRAAAGPDWTPGDPTAIRRSRPVPQARQALPADQFAAASPQPQSNPEATLTQPVDPALLQYADPDERRALGLYLVQHSDDWRTWIPALFPQFATRGFAPHHEEFWNHVWSIEAQRRPRPYVLIWGRGAAKSSSMEMAVVALAARRRRRYCWYISSRQQQADDHLTSIGAMLQGSTLAAAYPNLADRRVDKFGHSQGWRRNRLWTADGFVADALGLDVAVRGVRVEEQRPDLICLDDIDLASDTPAAIGKKIRAITRDILPAGTTDVAVLAGQNLIHSESIFAQLASTGKPGQPEPATFLADRVVAGPIPAIYDLEVEHRTTGDGRTRCVITGGTPSWPARGLAPEQDLIDTIGYAAYAAECQHEDPDLRGGWFDHLDFSDSGPIRIAEALLPEMVRTAVVVDPAVTSTDKSDSCGIVVMSLGRDRRFYTQWAWEQVASPAEAMRVAVTAAIEFGAQAVVVETDQGGDTWQLAFETVRGAVVEELIADNAGEIPDGLFLPRFEQAKAGSTGMSKRERIAKLRVDYEIGPRIRHVAGGAHALEKGLRRFPLFKPYDVVDAAWHARNWLGGKGRGDLPVGGRTRTRAARGVLPSFSPSSLPGAH
jgi:hypothetical protein